MYLLFILNILFLQKSASSNSNCSWSSFFCCIKEKEEETVRTSSLQEGATSKIVSTMSCYENKGSINIKKFFVDGRVDYSITEKKNFLEPLCMEIKLFQSLRQSDLITNNIKKNCENISDCVIAMSLFLEKVVSKFKIIKYKDHAPHIIIFFSHKEGGEEQSIGEKNMEILIYDNFSRRIELEYENIHI
jgi:hypothetical protein